MAAMKTQGLCVLVVILSFTLGGCASVRELRSLSQPQNQRLVGSVGSVLVRLNKTGDLPNAFGGRDIYGGKVDRGYAEVRLVGTRGGKIVDLIVAEESVNSTETTMDRYGNRPVISATQSVIVGSPASAGVPVSVDTSSDRDFMIAGLKISFLEVRASSVVFEVKDLMSN